MITLGVPSQAPLVHFDCCFHSCMRKKVARFFHSAQMVSAQPVHCAIVKMNAACNTACFTCSFGLFVNSLNTWVFRQCTSCEALLCVHATCSRFCTAGSSFHLVTERHLLRAFAEKACCSFLICANTAASSWHEVGTFKRMLQRCDGLILTWKICHDCSFYLRSPCFSFLFVCIMVIGKQLVESSLTVFKINLSGFIS